jgi:hypothetical protein
MKRSLIPAFAASLGSASAQTFTLDWFTPGGGGGSVSGGAYTINGTVGQPEAPLRLKCPEIDLMP